MNQFRHKYQLNDVENGISETLEKKGTVILPPMDVNDSIHLIKSLNFDITVTMIDPWYNRGIGGVRDDYINYILKILEDLKEITNHLFLWGFPEIVALFVDKVPKPLEFLTWLTWYYKNNPSVIKGWRSSQQACLHLAKKGAKLYPENFFNHIQRERYENKKMRFIPGPPSVIEESLLVGFVGKKEQTGHPAQKPVKVYEKLILMTTKKNDIVFDPMCGSGTTAAACLELGVKSIISDNSEEYIQICENRLDSERFNLSNPKQLIKPSKKLPRVNKDGQLRLNFPDF